MTMQTSNVRLVLELCLVKPRPIFLLGSSNNLGEGQNLAPFRQKRKAVSNVILMEEKVVASWSFADFVFGKDGFFKIDLRWRFLPKKKGEVQEVPTTKTIAKSVLRLLS
jgi:hypothetical protein